MQIAWYPRSTKQEVGKIKIKMDVGSRAIVDATKEFSVGVQKSKNSK
jgi:hypothetical protein